MRKIKKIEAMPQQIAVRKKVAAYARVSMETERLHHSLSAQISYYNELIQKNPSWEFAGVYADEGISGTAADKRPRFQQMLADCEAGKIDIILTKSISRFARNTVDLLNTVRHLKKLGIEVRFEKENIHSLSGDGEVMLTLLASFAQEESRSISDNVKWGVRKRMANGISGHAQIYGYRWENDVLIPIPDEATVVKRIFQNFLDGKSRLETEREFAAEGITTRSGCRWVDSNIKKVLTNITYTGNLLLQKEFISDPITKKRKQNHGELPQYWVENTHEPLIDLETFRWIQDEIARRRELGPLANKSLNTTCFTGKLKCAKCGCSFVRNTRVNRAKYTTTYGDKVISWVCSTTKKKGGRCPTRDIPENVLKDVCAKVLDSPEFDESSFLEKIEHITVYEDHDLDFHFKTGEIVQTQWKSTAKADCWTDEYKDRQRQWVRQYMADGNGRFSEFTTRITCKHCGAAFRRASQPNRSAEGSKVAYWRCSAPNKTCGTKGLREDFLREKARQALGLDNYTPDAFRKLVDHIEVAPDMTLKFHLKDGTVSSILYDVKRQQPGWTEERRIKQTAAIRNSFTDERRQKMSETMKRIRKEKKWASKRR